MATLEKDLLLRISTLVEGSQDVRQLKEEISKLGKQRIPDTTKQFRGGLSQTRGVLAGLLGLLSGAALVRGISSVTGQLEDVARTAESLGTGVEQIQELNFTFRQFGLESNDVSDALSTIADRALDAVGGAKSMQEDFALAGISIDDLRGKKPDELFELIADRVSKIDDPTKRSAFAVRTFGDDLGRKLLPLLLSGAEGLDDMRTQARDLGAVLDGETVEAARASSREFRKVADTLKAQFARAVAESSSEIQNLVGTLTEPSTLQAVATFTSLLITGFSKAATFITGVVDGVADFADATRNDTLAELRQELDQIDEKLQEGVFGRTGIFKLGGKIELFLSEDELQAERKKVSDQIAILETEATAASSSGEGEGDSGSGGGGGTLIDPAAIEAEARRRASISAIIEKLKEQNATTGEAAQAVELYRLRQLGASETELQRAEELLKQNTLLKAEEEAIKATQRATEEAAQAKADAAEQAARDRQDAIQNNADVLARLKEESDLLRIEMDEGARAAFVERAVRQLEQVEGLDLPVEEVREFAGGLFDLREAAAEAGDGVNQFAIQAARNIQDSLGESLKDAITGDFDEIGDRFKDLLTDMLAQALAARIGESLFGNFGESGELGGLAGSALGALGGLFGGARESGGPVQAGRAYVVGEKRPELYVPKMDGTIIPRIDVLRPTAALSGSGPASQPSAQSINIQLSPGMMDMTLREWIEREVASDWANR